MDKPVLTEILTFVEKLYTPIQEALKNNNESIVRLTTNVNTLVTLLQSNPSHREIVDKLREMFDDHESACAERTRDTGRAHCTTIQKDIDDLETVIRDNKNDVSKMCEQVSKMKDRQVWLLTVMSLGFTIGSGAVLWMWWALNHLPVGK